jgi:beta-glucosidase
VLSTTPVDGVLAYTEGIHIGYRAWLKHDVAPAYWFGHGLGYTDIAVTDVTAPATASGWRGRRRVRLARQHGPARRQAGGAGLRRARGVRGRPSGPLARGVRPRAVAAGESATVDVEVSTRLLAYWADGWTYEPGATAPGRHQRRRPALRHDPWS